MPSADWSASLDDPSRSTELRLALTSAIDELPPDYRTALVLRDVEGLGNAEMAEALAQPPQFEGGHDRPSGTALTQAPSS